MPGKKDVHAFLDDVDNDGDLQSKVAGSLKIVHGIAQAHGYKFSEQDLRDGLRERWGMSTPPDAHGHPDTCFFA